MLLAPFPIFLLLPAPFSKFLCSLLSDNVFLAPCSLPYFRPCSLLPWVSRAILPAPWLPLTGVHLCSTSCRLILSLLFIECTIPGFMSDMLLYKLFRVAWSKLLQDVMTFFNCHQQHKSPSNGQISVDLMCWRECFWSDCVNIYLHTDILHLTSLISANGLPLRADQAEAKTH